MIRRVVYGLGAVSLLAVATLSSSCSAGARQTTVIPEERVSKVATGSLTPIERGKLRREVLKVAREAMDAFLADDPVRIEKYFHEEYVDYWAKQRAENAAKGQVWVRKHRPEEIDVTTIDERGDSALVEYFFSNDSYYADKAGKPKTAPVGDDDVMVQLTLEKSKDGWTVRRMIGNEEATR